MSSNSYNCYDGLGRLVHGAQTTATVPYQFTYGYNAAGSVTSMTYPSGRQVSYSYDSAGRAASVKDAVANANYWSGILYAPHGGMTSATLRNGVVEYQLQPPVPAGGSSGAASEHEPAEPIVFLLYRATIVLREQQRECADPDRLARISKLDPEL